MKKILVLLLLFFSFLAGFSQTGNDTTKYTWYKYTYGNRLQRYWADSVLDIPHDTTHSKYGLARKHDSVYVGNGIRWTLISSISPVDTVSVTPIGTGSPQIQTLWASADGNLRTARHIPGVFTTPFQNGDSAYGVNLDTSGVGGAAYKQWIIDQYGPPFGGSGTNIYNSNGTLTDDRHLSGPLSVGAPTKTLYFDSLLQFYINASGLGNGVDIYGLTSTSHFQVGSNQITETAFNVASDKVSYNSLQGDSTLFSTYTAGDTSRITLSPNYMNFYQANGVYRFRNLVQGNDTSTLKPIGATSNGTLKRMDGWAGSGSGSSGYSVTTAANTANYTVPTGRKVYVKLSDLTGQANRNVVLPAATSGDEFVFTNINTSASTFVWTFTSGTVKDYGQNTITTLTNLTVYHLVYDGTNYQIIN